MLMAERMVCVSGDYVLSVSDARGRSWFNVASPGKSVTLPVPRPREMTGIVAISNSTDGVVTVSCPGHFKGPHDSVTVGPDRVGFFKAVFDGLGRIWTGCVMDGLLVGVAQIDVAVEVVAETVSEAVTKKRVSRKSK